ncbi:MAG: hypothetical protein QXW27_05060 [Candidatus Methanomethylicaceae archaeon]
MRIMEISIFLWCFLLMAGAFQASVPNIFGGENTLNITIPNYLPNATEISNTFTNETELSYYQAITLGGIQWIISGINTLWIIFTPAINIGGWLHGLLPFLPIAFCNALTIITWIIYIVGLIQFITGRSMKIMR